MTVQEGAQGAPQRGIVPGRVRWFGLFSLLSLAATLLEILTDSTKVLGLLASPLGFAVLARPKG